MSNFQIPWGSDEQSSSSSLRSTANRQQQSQWFVGGPPLREKEPRDVEGWKEAREATQ